MRDPRQASGDDVDALGDGSLDPAAPSQTSPRSASPRKGPSGPTASPARSATAETVGGSVDWRHLDLTSAPSIVELVDAVRPSVVVHTAYVESGPDLEAVTARAPAHLARAALDVGARFVHVSSDVVLGGRCGHTFGDDAGTAPVHAYGRAKAEAESRVLAVDPSALVVRTSLLMARSDAAPGRHERLVLDALDGSVETTFFEDEIRCPVVVDDLAAALLALAATDLRGTVNAAGADAVSRAELAALVARSRGLDAEGLTFGPTPPSLVARRPRCVVLDSSTAAAVHPLPGVRERLAR